MTQYLYYYIVTRLLLVSIPVLFQHLSPVSSETAPHLQPPPSSSTTPHLRRVEISTHFYRFFLSFLSTSSPSYASDYFIPRDTMATEASIALTNRSLRTIRTVGNLNVHHQDGQLTMIRNLNFLQTPPSSPLNSYRPFSLNYQPRHLYMLLSRPPSIMSQQTLQLINSRT